MKHEKLIIGLLAAILTLNIAFMGIFLVKEKKIKEYIWEQKYSILEEIWEIRTYVESIALMIK